MNPKRNINCVSHNRPYDTDKGEKRFNCARAVSSEDFSNKHAIRADNANRGHNAILYLE